VDDRAGRITELVNLLGNEQPEATAELLPIVYQELRALAGSYLRDRPPGHTLQPTALVHEAYMKLAGSEHLRVTSKDHFFAIAAKAMRHVLADHARAKGRLKRGGEFERVTLTGLASDTGDVEYDAADIDAALQELSAFNERHATVVELRFFAGLTLDQVAALLKVSRRTVADDWSFARAWLRRRLSRDDA